MTKKNAVSQKVREDIINGALTIFACGDYEKVTMDDVAKYSKHCKRTVYNYFSTKEAIYYAVILRSFIRLHTAITENVTTQQDPQTGAANQADKNAVRTFLRLQFFNLCAVLADLYDKNPLAFEAILRFSALPAPHSPYVEVLTKIYETGERINAVLCQFLHRMTEAGETKKDLPAIPTIFMLWASISGIVAFSRAKSAYLEQAAAMNRQTFLEYSFELLYCSFTK